MTCPGDVEHKRKGRCDEPHREQHSKGGFATKRQANAYLTNVLAEVQAGVFVAPTKFTVAQYLNDHWLPSLDLRPSTLASYGHMVRAWIVPALGGRPLAQLTPKQIADFYTSLRGAPRKTRSKKKDKTQAPPPISGRTAQYVAVVLRRALEDALRLGLISRNPASAVARPRAARVEMKAWTAEEAATFLSAVSEDRLYAGWLLLLCRGLRRGEMAGLRWSDVDLDAGRLAIRQTLVAVGYEAQFSEPKTAKSRRTVPLDAELVTALHTHRRHQLEERLAWGAGYCESGLVFCREDGSPIHPQRLSALFQGHLRRAELPPIRLHDLRHTCATLSLRSGIPTKVVSEWLGHATTSITEDLYRHVTPAMLEEAGARLTAIVLGARSADADG
jgi:integrase